MKKFLSLILAGTFLVGPTLPVMADSKTFTVTAQIPQASSILFTVNKITGASSSIVAGTQLSFDPLGFDPVNSIWLPDHYFSIVVSPASGAGNIDVTVNYTEGANPNSATTGHGLGWKSTMTFFTVAAGLEVPLLLHGPKKMLKDLVNEHFSSTELIGGNLKAYLGVVTKDPAAVYLDPAASEVITNADKPGIYDGTLLITATIV